jgi:hypothetical protein
MDNFDLKKYLAEGKLLKEDVSKDPSFVRTKEGLKQIFQQMLSGELSGKEANDQISDFTFGQGSMGIYPDTNSLFLRQFGMGGGDFNDYIIGKFENGGFTPATQPKSKTALKIWNYLSNLKLAEGKLLKEEQMGSYRKFLKVVKSYEDEEILSDFLDSYPKGQDISKSEYDKFTEKHLGLADPEDHRGENWKYIMSEGKLLKENAPGYDTRKFGESLPTMESVKAAYEAKNNIKEESTEVFTDAELDMASDMLMDMYDKLGLEDSVERSDALFKVIEAFFETLD